MRAQSLTVFVSIVAPLSAAGRDPAVARSGGASSLSMSAGTVPIVMAAPASPGHHATLTPPLASPDVQAMFNAVNAIRRQYGLRALSEDPRLTQAAATQARYLARTGRLDHRGANGSSVGQRAQRAGYDWSDVEENLARTRSSASRVVQMWMNSRGHRANMLSRRVTQMGGAHVGTVWVLVLARPL